MSQIYKTQTGGGGGGSPVLTVSGEDINPVGPTAGNMNFSGTVGGGYGANGAITALTAGPGEVNLQVLVDGTTIAINGANRLTAIGGATPFVWQFETSFAVMSPGNGYFANAPLAPGVAFSMPPLGSVIGNEISIYDFSGAGFFITQNAGQQIQINDLSTSSGAGVKISSSQTQGNAMTLICAGVILGVEWWVSFPDEAQLKVS
ncbi:MAG TPA: hypothetical protein VIJ14_07915 [Rhabdochlamydiaceae bacterium]